MEKKTRKAEEETVKAINHDGQCYVGIEEARKGLSNLGKHEWITNLEGFMICHLNK